MMPKFLKKLLKIFAILSVAFIAFLGFVYVKYSNFDGYCEEAGRVLTKEELIKRAVRKDIYEDNPYCCGIAPGGWMTSENENFLNMLFGYYNYQIMLYYKRDTPLTYDFNDPYFERSLVIDECGHPLNSYGAMTISERSYNAAINSRKKHYIMKGEKR